MKTITFTLSLAAGFFIADLHAQPALPVLQVASLGGHQVMLSWPATNTAYGLEYADSPTATNWYQVKADVTNALCIVMDSPTDSTRFYRLVSPFGTNLPPLLPDGKPMYAQGDPYYEEGYTSDSYFMNSLYFNVPFVSLSNGIYFDATEIIDPASPTNNSLSYLWTVVSYNLGYDLISPLLNGTATSKLSSNMVAFTDGEYYFYLTVTSKYSGLSANFEIDADQMFGSIASLSWLNESSTNNTVVVPRYEGHLYGYSEVVGFY